MNPDRTVSDALTQEIDKHPELLRALDAALVERMRRLVAGVEVDLDQRLPHELGDAGMPGSPAWLIR